MSFYSAFTHLFPPPSYMRMPSIGVDISDASIKYIHFHPAHGADDLALDVFGDEPLEEGVVVGGEIQNAKTLIATLQKVRQKSSTPYVRVSLPEERAYIFETVVADTTPFNEIRGLLEFSLEENVPLSPKDAFFDYQIVEDITTEHMLRIVVTVYARDVILSYYEACVAAGFTPIAFEVEAAAVARAVTPREKNETFMLVDFGRRRTGIGIVHNGILVYTSTVEVGGATLSAAMRGVLGDTDEEALTVMKNTFGIDAGHRDPAVREVLLAQIDTLIDALRARFEYWNTRSEEHGTRPIAHLVLCGGSSNLLGLPEYLEKALEVPATRANVWERAFPSGETVPAIPKTHSYGYTTAIGLALAEHTDFLVRHTS